MHVSLFTIVMTVLWSSALIIVLYILRKKLLVLEACSVSGIVFIYLFCAIRLLFPIEFPWTKVIDGGALWDSLKLFISFELAHIGGATVTVGHILIAIWGIVAGYKIIKIVISNQKLHHFVGKIPKQKMESVLPDVSGIKVYKTGGITTPCAVGIFNRNVLFPDREYTKEQEAYILMHEISHHRNNDILIKFFTNILCALYWWNPFVYLLKKDLNQSLEIRCDQNVTQYLGKKDKARYLSVILNEFKNTADVSSDTSEYMMEIWGNEEDDLVERFKMVANGKYHVSVWKKMVVVGCMIIILIMSYSVVLQSSFDPVYEEEEGVYYFDTKNAYVLMHRDGTYSLITPFEEMTIEEEEAMWYLNEGFSLKKE